MFEQEKIDSGEPVESSGSDRLAMASNVCQQLYTHSLRSVKRFRGGPQKNIPARRNPPADKAREILQKKGEVKTIIGGHREKSNLLAVSSPMFRVKYQQLIGNGAEFFANGSFSYPENAWNREKSAFQMEIGLSR